jgi:ssDNA-binding Zn-finger/Zn-ribbon topoisomerase 1
MKLRAGRFGSFFGCNNYPKCKGKVPAPPELVEQLQGAMAQT